MSSDIEYMSYFYFHYECLMYVILLQEIVFQRLIFAVFNTFKINFKTTIMSFCECYN